MPSKRLVVEAPGNLPQAEHFSILRRTDLSNHHQITYVSMRFIAPNL